MPEGMSYQIAALDICLELAHIQIIILPYLHCILGSTSPIYLLLYSVGLNWLIMITVPICEWFNSKLSTLEALTANCAIVDASSKISGLPHLTGPEFGPIIQSHRDAYMIPDCADLCKHSCCSLSTRSLRPSSVICDDYGSIYDSYGLIPLHL